MDNPYFSIIIPTYNRKRFLNKSISSVLNQSFNNFELIIIDDASTDDTKSTIEAFNDPRIIYSRNATNQERCISRNNGIKLSKGKYLCFLDSDDWYKENHLLNFHREIEKRFEPKAILFSGALNYTSEELTERPQAVYDGTDKYGYLLINTFGLPFSCVHYEVFNDFQLDPEIMVCEDLDFFLRSCTKYKIIQINSKEYVYNLHDETFTLGAPNKIELEYKNYKKIFSKEILYGKLPFKQRYQLLSKCHFFFALKTTDSKHKIKTLRHAVLSFLLFPSGYNGKTNKILFTTFIYNIPLIGPFMKSTILKTKKYD